MFLEASYIIEYESGIFMIFVILSAIVLLHVIWLIPLYYFLLIIYIFKK